MLSLCVCVSLSLSLSLSVLLSLSSCVLLRGNLATAVPPRFRS